MEATYLSFDRVLIYRFENSKNIFNQIIFYFIKNIKHFLVIILFTNLLANTFLIWLSYVLLKDNFIEFTQLDTFWGNVIFTGLLTFFILIFIEFIPKQIGVVFNRFVVYLFTPFFVPLYFLFYPLASLYNRLFDLIMKNILKKDTTDELEKIDKRELLQYINLSNENGALSNIESLMIKNIVRHKELPTRTVMVPRMMIEAFDMSTLNGNITNKIKQFLYNHLIFYKESMDNIVGIVNKKDLFYEKIDEIDEDVLKKHMKSPQFVLDSIPIIEVFKKMHDVQLDIFFVLDEFGGLQGLVSYHDIINKVLGRVNVTDIEKSRGIIFLGSNHYLVKGNLTIVNFNNYFKQDTFYKNVETISGYIIENMKRIPRVGDVFENESFVFTIKETTDRRVNEILVKKKDNQNEY